MTISLFGIKQRKSFSTLAFWACKLFLVRSVHTLISRCTLLKKLPHLRWTLKVTARVVLVVHSMVFRCGISVSVFVFSVMSVISKIFLQWNLESSYCRRAVVYVIAMAARFPFFIFYFRETVSDVPTFPLSRKQICWTFAYDSGWFCW